VILSFLALFSVFTFKFSRYMDPIIIGFGKNISQKEKYNELVDVYSFCIFLWQTLALETPYEGYPTWNSFQKKVVMGGTRPKCPSEWSPSLCRMMRLGWGDICNRPSMTDVWKELQKQLGGELTSFQQEKVNDTASACTEATDSSSDDPGDVLLNKIGALNVPGESTEATDDTGIVNDEETTLSSKSCISGKKETAYTMSLVFDSFLGSCCGSCPVASTT